MKKIDNYFEQLATAFAVEYVVRTHMYNLVIGKECSGCLYLTFRSPEQKTSACVNAKQLYIHPTKEKAHHLDIDEIWIGFDGEGSQWSDHMGGREIDCTGMTFQSSIDHMVKEIVTHFNHLMK